VECDRDRPLRGVVVHTLDQHPHELGLLLRRQPRPDAVELAESGIDLGLRDLPRVGVRDLAPERGGPLVGRLDVLVEVGQPGGGVAVGGGVARRAAQVGVKAGEFSLDNDQLALGLGPLLRHLVAALRQREREQHRVLPDPFDLLDHEALDLQRRGATGTGRRHSPASGPCSRRSSGRRGPCPCWRWCAPS